MVWERLRRGPYGDTIVCGQSGPKDLVANVRTAESVGFGFP